MVASLVEVVSLPKLIGNSCCMVRVHLISGPERDYSCPLSSCIWWGGGKGNEEVQLKRNSLKNTISLKWATEKRMRGVGYK